MPFRIRILRNFLLQVFEIHKFFGTAYWDILEVTPFKWIRFGTGSGLAGRGCRSGSAKNDADLTGSGLAGPWCRSGSAKNDVDLTGSGSTILIWRAQVKSATFQTVSCLAEKLFPVFPKLTCGRKTMISTYTSTPGPQVSGPPGSGSVSYGYRSGSFPLQAKIVRKTLNFTDIWLLYDFLSWRMM